MKLGYVFHQWRMVAKLAKLVKNFLLHGETFQLKMNSNVMVIVVVMSGEMDQNH